MHRKTSLSNRLEKVKKKYLGRVVSDSRSLAGNWLGFTLEALERGKAVLSLMVRPEMTNPYRHIHGGMMSLVADEAIGWAVRSLDTQNYYTSLNLQIDFLYAIPQGERLFATAWVVREGKKIIHLACEVYDIENRLLARASSNLIVTGMRPPDPES